MRVLIPSLQSHIEEKIWGFRNLEPGWHFGEGGVFDDDVLWEAIRIHQLLQSRGYGNTDAFPGLDGEVRITAYDQDYYFEFTLEADRTWTFLMESGEKLLFRHEGLKQSQLEAIVQNFLAGCETEFFN